jgi:hypothetical protein
MSDQALRSALAMTIFMATSKGKARLPPSEAFLQFRLDSEIEVLNPVGFWPTVTASALRPARVGCRPDDGVRGVEVRRGTGNDHRGHPTVARLYGPYGPVAVL